MCLGKSREKIRQRYMFHPGPRRRFLFITTFTMITLTNVLTLSVKFIQCSHYFCRKMVSTAICSADYSEHQHVLNQNFSFFFFCVNKFLFIMMRKCEVRYICRAYNYISTLLIDLHCLLTYFLYAKYYQYLIKLCHFFSCFFMSFFSCATIPSNSNNCLIRKIRSYIFKGLFWHAIAYR